MRFELNDDERYEGRIFYDIILFQHRGTSARCVLCDDIR